MSERANQLIKKALDENATYLDLGNCGLTDLSEIPLLFECVQLETLVLSNVWYEKGKTIVKSANKGDANTLNELSPLFKNLKNLKKLICVGDVLYELKIIDVTLYKNFDMRNNQISDITALKGLQHLTYLDLMGNQIRDIAALKSLQRLTYLDLSANIVNDITVLKDLQNLTDLTLTSNQINDFAVLKDLKKLTYLNLRRNQFTNITVLKDLKNLTNLDLSAIEVTDITVLKDLQNLTNLNLGANKVTDITVLGDLQNLTNLNLSNNQITDISFLTDLKNLTNLELRSNYITNISFLQPLTNLKSLYLSDNPIQYIPKEIYEDDNCIEALSAYWSAMKSSKLVNNNQLKIMFLGNGCTGKTTLLHWFIDNAFKDIDLKHRTEGIIIQPLPLCDGKTLGNFWDFGGQEVYHATHRLFLGRRTLYILVWATDTPERIEEQRHPPQYWLDMIADIADKREPSRVLIVQNLFDNQTVQNIISNEELQDYKQRGLEIKTMSVNAKTGDDIDSFKVSVEGNVKKLLQTYQEELPETWVNIRTAVAKRRENKEKTLTFADFEQICLDCKLTGNPSVILGYLHRAGEVYYYTHQFQNKIILDQEWALKAVYAVLKGKRIDRYKGIFELDDLIDIWREGNPDLTKEDAQIFLNFMLSNQIMFYTEGGNSSEENKQFVIPQLLEDKTPLSYKTNKGKADNLIHRIEYAFLHRDIIERFIVNTAHFCKEKEYWRNGVFIEYQNSFAIVEAIKEEKTIHIECFGQEKGLLLQKIREEFNKIRPLEKAKEYRIIKGDKIHFNDKMPIQNDDKKSGLSDEALDKALSAKIENAINTALEKMTLFKNDNTSKSMKRHLLNLISDGKLKEALDLMRQIEDTQSSYFQNPLIGFLSRFNRNENDKNGGTLSQTDYNIERNRIEAAVKSLLDSEFDDSKAPTPPKNEQKQDKPVKNNQKSVFISYNHKDAESANKIKHCLENHGINVVIDTENLDAGEDIKAFIEKSVRENGATVSVVSPNSLMSAWVAMESVNTLYAQKMTDKKFIAACIDNSFFKRSFVDEALDKIEAEIKDIQETITKRLAKNRNITDLQNELSRYADLQHNLPTIVQKLKESLSVDVSGDNFEKGMDKIMGSI